MKLKQGLGVALASTILLAGCTTDKGEMKSYNKQIQKAFDDEKSINTSSKKLNELEQKKNKLVQSLKGKDQDKEQKVAKKVIDNTKERQQTFKEEENAMDKSHQDYKKATKHIKNIENSKKQREVKQLDSALKDKYKAHDKYAEAYKNVMSKEKDMFEYASKGQPSQGELDKKSHSISDAYKNMNKQFKNYSNAMKKVKDEKQDVDNLM
ncbi:YkyA family protein [Staphylococcus durrellii]|uniref:YkyA family protein n=1 Tax=Staphylococcus durrellii TaxID=2781773 RepID=UPI00189EFF72|nr:YkyA family protein [Staphylococcus durrellii]MBF7017418.1 YkyA family protein [Staphylococcus durrellii]